MKITLKDGQRGGWLKQIGREVKPGDVVEVDEQLGKDLVGTGEFVEAADESVHHGVTESTEKNASPQRHRGTERNG
jgi:uncharacterized SAM-dependent methyltransferase